MGISLQQLNRATLDTQRELGSHGFWNERSRLLKIDVVWCSYPYPVLFDCWGAFFHGQGWGGKMLNLAKGNIYIPAWSICHFSPKSKPSTRDVVRHEYAHGISHFYPRLIQHAGQFRDVFGGDYWAESHNRSEHHDEFVSDYARTKPMEDYAETFMVFLRHKGELPARFRIPAMKRKWRFVRDLGLAIGSGHHSW